MVRQAAQAFKEPGAGGTTPILPATGSTMTAAISCPNFSKLHARVLQIVVRHR